ncbi:hypothetical protein [Dyadobacter sp. CY347]|uniref:hypothetical protein n=1 Tax=Dyadobacter sp. CY347 TaxID=2909336 RepID=UPI001F21C8A4|nr:hypothetical protein [Dyadobacter sp. CY347]MCF2487724.1 hypothetical protein [Dyadobacter sp. CY347]
MKKIGFLALMLVFGTNCVGQTLTIANLPLGATWTVPTLSSSVTTAGKDYVVYGETSVVAQTTLMINALLFWTVNVQLSTTTNWNPRLKVYVVRTGNGTGGAILNGGTTYKEVTTTTQAFFSGSLGLNYARDNVPVQYKIEGMSVMLPAKTYTTTIVYTVSGI